MMKKLSIVAIIFALFLVSCNKKIENMKVLIETSEGNIVVQLYDDTPLHRDNFLKLVAEGFYDGVIFHRVIESFMIQTGDPDSKNPVAGARYGSGGPSYTLKAEILPQYFHKKGALSAARQSDHVNPEKRSSGSQFYIVQGNVYEKDQISQLQESKKQGKMQNAFSVFLQDPANAEYLEQLQTAQKNQDQDAYMDIISKIEPMIDAILDKDDSWQLTPEQIAAYTTVGGSPHLDNDYTVFGEVIEGIEIVDKIAATETSSGDRPVKDIFITKATIKK